MCSIFQEPEVVFGRKIAAIPAGAVAGRHEIRVRRERHPAATAARRQLVAQGWTASEPRSVHEREALAIAVQQIEPVCHHQPRASFDTRFAEWNVPLGSENPVTMRQNSWSLSRDGSDAATARASVVENGPAMARAAIATAAARARRRFINEVTPEGLDRRAGAWAQYRSRFARPGHPPANR